MLHRMRSHYLREVTETSVREIMSTLVHALRSRRLSACLAFVVGEVELATTLLVELEAAVRDCAWTDRDLSWQPAASRPLASGIQSGFRAGELFPWNSQELDELPPWSFFGPRRSLLRSSAQHTSGSDLVICASATSTEAHYDFAAVLMQHVLAHLEASAPTLLARVGGAGIVLVSAAKRLPILVLPRGIGDLCIPSEETRNPTAAQEMLRTAGLFAIPDALAATDTEALRRLVTARIHDAETAMADTGGDIQSGDYFFSEVIHRGLHRWDMVLYKRGEPVPASASTDPNYATLERIATTGPWLSTIIATFGEGEFKWEAGSTTS